jgi:hypothetical protein
MTHVVGLSVVLAAVADEHQCMRCYAVVVVSCHSRARRLCAVLFQLPVCELVRTNSDCTERHHVREHILLY